MKQTLQSSDTDTEAPQPACPTTARGTQKWRETEYTDALSGFFDPCSECFPQGVDVTTLDRVVLSRSHGCSFHRPAAKQSESANVAVVSDGGSISNPFTGCERVPITAVADLCPGDGVIWDDVTQPLLVHDRADTDIVHLRGPDGGDYYLEIRPGKMANVVNPGHGKVSALRRIIPPSECDYYDSIIDFYE
jgi:hypothetical protein